jgi:hypothetical protein
MRFIVEFPKTTHPITSLQKKGVKFEWSTKCEENSQCLKDLLTSATILKVEYQDEDLLCAHMHARKVLVESLHKMEM